MKFNIFLASVAAILLLINISVSNEQEQNIDKLEWWKKTNFYHIYIRSFCDSDGDGQGDLRGIIEKLDYLKEIGVDTLLLSPFYSSPMKDAGYDIDDYRAVSSNFGTMFDFEELVAGLKRRGMHLVVDFVPNHSSNLHPWFQCSERALIDPEKCGKYKDYYIWSSSTRFNNSYPSNWISVFGGGTVWQWSPIRKQFYLHQFLPEQPDLNLRNPLVREEFKEIARFWFRKGVDGLRADAVMHILENTDDFPDEPDNPNWKPTPEYDPYHRLLHTQTFALYDSAVLVKDWHDVAMELEFGGDKIIITEGYSTIDKVIDYHGKPGLVYAEMPFNFMLFGFSTSMNPKDVKRIITLWLDALQKLDWPKEKGAFMPWSCWVTGNHDNKRIINRVGLQYSEIYRWISYLAPGVTVNYYGDEIGLRDANFNSIPQSTIDEGEPTRLVFRAPMAWTKDKPAGGFSNNSNIWMPMNLDFEVNNVDSLMKKSSGHNHLKNFIELQRIRREKAAIFAFGDLVFFDNVQESSNILAMARTHNKFGNIILLANLDSSQSENVKLIPTESQLSRAKLTPPENGRILLVNEAGTRSLEPGKKVDFKNFTLGPNQAALFLY